jgi:hypothetical protein
VIKYNTSADLLFTADIKGLKPFYYAGEFLTFSVKPTMNCWIYVFCIPQNEDESYTLLPNDWESAEMLQSDLIYNFPQNVDFELSVDLQIQQTDRLVFVITKQKYPLPAGLSYKKLFDWIFNIPPDQRFISSYNITISKKSE